MFAIVPSTIEQHAIAAFLDRETTKIDALVAKEERLIELLQEKRAALITRAVTKGLDPNVPMKDSGVEWLGEIPAYWETKPLKALSQLQTGLTLGKKYDGRGLTTRPYLRVANVQDGYLDLSDIAEIELPEADATRYELRAGDVLMTEGGDFDKLGRGYVWEGQVAECLHQNHIFAVRPRGDLLMPRYLVLVMSSSYGRAYFTATSKQSTNLASTNSTKLRNFPMLVPTVAEQCAITTFTDLQATRIDALIAKVRAAIETLSELRTSLISAAVTGKIDVREETT
jgi:type I restriction enzyme S subunit